MEDNKLVNAYIDGSVAVMHDFLATILQLKAQLKVANDTIQENTKAVSEKFVPLEIMNVMKEDQVKRLDEIATLQANLASVQREVEAQKQKASHIDTFTNQINTFKNTILDNNKTIAHLESKNKECVDQILKLQEELEEKDKIIKKLEKLIPQEKVVKPKKPRPTKKTTDVVNVVTEVSTIPAQEGDDF